MLWKTLPTQPWSKRAPPSPRFLECGPRAVFVPLGQGEAHLVGRCRHAVLALVDIYAAEERIYPQAEAGGGGSKLHVQGLILELHLQSALVRQGFFGCLREVHIDLHLVALICEEVVLQIREPLFVDCVTAFQLHRCCRLHILGICRRHPAYVLHHIVVIVLFRGHLIQLLVHGLEVHPHLGDSLITAVLAIHGKLNHRSHLPWHVLVSVRLVTSLVHDVMC
mmetsp:Transcript_73475/g.215517  ORF Transcript_73475/g.215517 Transcript_73475/m.215517 type:complete len:222 (-) Transcript_73475:796-1461(-)